MQVLMTGATGYIGGAVAEALAARGHAVAGLARTEETAARLAARGYRPVRGDLRDRDTLESAVCAASQRATGRRARTLLGWSPTVPSIIEELLIGSYA